MIFLRGCLPEHNAIALGIDRTCFMNDSGARIFGRSVTKGIDIWLLSPDTKIRFEGEEFMRSRWIVAILIVWTVCGGFLLAGQGKGKGRGKHQTAGEEVREALPPSEAIFTEEEREVITGWYGGGRQGLPPGLAKKDRLPPGLEKQLRRRGSLPPGLQKKLQPVPVELQRRLRVLPTGYRRAVIGGNIVIMDEKTSLVYDIVRLVIP